MLEKWQWKSQFPSRSGTHVRRAVVNPRTSSVTAQRRSAGAYISALLANGVTPGVLYRSVTRRNALTTIDDLALFKLNASEIASRLAAAPLTVLDAAWDFYQNRRETTLTDRFFRGGESLHWSATGRNGTARIRSLDIWQVTDARHRSDRTN